MSRGELIRRFNEDRMAEPNHHRIHLSRPNTEKCGFFKGFWSCGDSTGRLRRTFNVKKQERKEAL